MVPAQILLKIAKDGRHCSLEWPLFDWPANWRPSCLSPYVGRNFAANFSISRIIASSSSLRTDFL